MCAALLALACACLLAGCVTERPVPRSALNDPCSERLQALCGLLLIRYAQDGRLPARLEELTVPADGQEPPPFVCPLSEQPYVYRPDGVIVQGRQGRLVLYDSAPVHDGERWGAFIIRASEAVCTAQVLRVPEDAFQEALAAQANAPAP